MPGHPVGLRRSNEPLVLISLGGDKHIPMTHLIDSWYYVGAAQMPYDRCTQVSLQDMDFVVLDLWISGLQRRW